MLVVTAIGERTDLIDGASNYFIEVTDADSGTQINIIVEQEEVQKLASIIPREEQEKPTSKKMRVVKETTESPDEFC